ncbi:anthranilate synthase component 2/para-aminobenzoate synthetase component 2 [Pseudidiomarina planktonica]|uniref:Anthranilate synthase component 2/para-aminobenzoate synthetase component 2 n=1 Tax=Pseudidiomarina planktonica TaxID=1323738 RepID=A0A1Y6FXK1_9GAMM|nr:aminodeoxychorismate/anthranilate synthase component II [Pseudidiomarina planktonica]RUO63843.1 type 1 glutamine amidotransferase [Pseudidiomarina planktonica]SMQ80088.1 anthranilate synthase component 2/para-aminobenzoate synthetase component 2 [Pseudidiomarina planktonica]
MLVMIDNYDSFTFNVVRYFRELGAQLKVIRNDAISIAALADLQPSGIIISPGPGTPDNSGISLGVIERYAGIVPILGVCLGHQAIGQVFGAEVKPAKQVMHGKTSLLNHSNQGLFAGLPTSFAVARYHSLLLTAATIPAEFSVDAWVNQSDTNTDKEVMAIRHQTMPLWGVQFHPEAILTEYGHDVLARFMQEANAWQRKQ